MIELPSGMFINLTRVCYIRDDGDKFTVIFNERLLSITKTDMDKIREINNLGMSILNEISKAVV